MLARHNHSGVHVAVKIIELDGMPADPKQWSEVTALQSLRHPHVVRLFDVIRAPRYLCLVLEYLSGGELFDYLVTRHRLLERQAAPFIRQVYSSMLGRCYRFCWFALLAWLFVLQLRLLCQTQACAFFFLSLSLFFFFFFFSFFTTHCSNQATD